jgi:hypothetical protein
VVEEWRDGELVGRYGEDATKPNSDVWVMKGVRGGGATARRRWWWQDVLLPEGYPESVSGDYATYQTWDTVQALCSSITGLLCTRALLQGPPLYLYRHSGKLTDPLGCRGGGGRRGRHARGSGGAVGAKGRRRHGGPHRLRMASGTC